MTLSKRLKYFRYNTNLMRSYNRTWDDIEKMLTDAERTQQVWKTKFQLAKKREDKQVMKDAARNHKALDGVVKTLKWTLGEDGIDDPLN